MSTNEWRNLPTMADVAAAQAAGDEIQYRAHETYEWRSWRGEIWDKDWLFSARPAQPKMKKVKLLGWLHPSTGDTCTSLESLSKEMIDARWIRYPKLDDEIEVPE